MNSTSEIKVYIDEKEFLINNLNYDQGKLDIDTTINFVSEIRKKTDEFLDNLLKINPQFIFQDKKLKTEDEDEEIE